METIEVYWDPNGIVEASSGCYRARLKEDHGYHDAGKTQENAIKNLLITLKSLGKSGNREDYKIEVD